MIKGYITAEKMQAQAVILANSLRKQYRHVRKRFAREAIECFRLYDWDSPDIRLAVDWYQGHLVVAEYERRQTGPEYLPFMAAAAATALSVPPERVYLKRRRTHGADGTRYAKPRRGDGGNRLAVTEGPLRFWVNLSDYLDTGLFSDHRGTRKIFAQAATGQDVLNLFCYTGSFTCAAAAGGARSTVSVDRSETYLHWLKDNLVLNRLWGPQHTLVQADVRTYLQQAVRQPRRFTLALVDPPSFFQTQREQASFDINRDHPDLLRKVLPLMQPGAEIFFSTNHQRFTPCFDGLAVRQVRQLTPKTIPEDYRNKQIHQCWRLSV